MPEPDPGKRTDFGVAAPGCGPGKENLDGAVFDRVVDPHMPVDEQPGEREHH
jgi:hypothetical protein